MSESRLLKYPSAFLPLAMSLGALATIVIHLAFFGTEPQPDEGAAAHLWQLLMAGQVPIIFFFAVTSPPPRAACRPISNSAAMPWS